MICQAAGGNGHHPVVVIELHVDIGRKWVAHSVEITQDQNEVREVGGAILIRITIWGVPLAQYDGDVIKPHAAVFRKICGTAQSVGLGEGGGRKKGRPCRKKNSGTKIDSHGDFLQ